MGDTTTWHDDSDGRQDDGKGQNSDGLHNDGKGQQDDGQYNNGNGRYDDAARRRQCAAR